MLADMLIFNNFRYPISGVKFDCHYEGEFYRLHEFPKIKFSDVAICKTLNEYCDRLAKYVDWFALNYNCCTKRISHVCGCCMKISGYGFIAEAKDTHHARLYRLNQQLVQRLKKDGSRFMVLLKFLLDHLDTDILLFYKLFESEFFNLPSNAKKTSKAFSDVHVTLQAIVDYTIALLNEPECFTDTIVTTALKNNIHLKTELLPQRIQEEVEYFQFKRTLLLCGDFGCDHAYGAVSPSLISLSLEDKDVKSGINPLCSRKPISALSNID